MNTTYDNTNRGAIWKNDRKETDRHPDFKGSINVDGTEYWLSGWKRDPNGNPNAPALSLSVQPKEQPAQKNAAAEGAPAGGDPFDIDEDVPF